MANADFTKRLEGTSLEAESILSSNHWIPTNTLQRRNGTGANRRNERLTMVLLYRALAGTSRSPSTILATEASISDWHLGCIVAFGGATVMESVFWGFSRCIFYGSLEFLGDFSTHTLPGCRNKSRGDRKGYSIQKAMPHGPDAALRKRGNQSPLFKLDIWGQSLIPNLKIEKPVTQELWEGNHEKPNRR